MTSAINRMPLSHVTEEQGEEVMHRQTEALPYPLETVVKMPISMKARGNIKYI